MTRSKITYHQSPDSRAAVLREDGIEYGFIGKLQNLNYEYRDDIRDRATLEANFRDKFEALNRVQLTDGEFARLLDEIVTQDVFTAANTLRERNAFTRDDGTPLNYTLVNRLLSEDYAGKVIVTTIQKLGLALDETSKRNQQRRKNDQLTYKELLEPLRDKRIVFIFDECHRSQFGDNHKAIKAFFPQAQLIGLIGSDAKFMNEREDIAEYIGALKAGEGLSEKAIREGYSSFKKEKTPPIWLPSRGSTASPPSPYKLSWTASSTA